jgi:hypothetical protein
MNGVDGAARKPRGRGESSSDVRARNPEASYLSPPYTKDVKPRAIKDTNSPADSLLDLYAGNKSELAGDSRKRAVNEVSTNGNADEHSKWIHRDKLARIESEELQAAGIILPRAPRARSKSQSRTRRESSLDRVNNVRAKPATGSIDQTTPRSRKNSELTVDPHTPEASLTPSWDLRLPEEIDSEVGGYWVSNGGGKGVSKIPVAKLSPVPIPVEHIERGTPIHRKRDGSPGEEDSIVYPKPRARSGSAGNSLASSTNLPAMQPAKRSVTDTSPKKAAAGRKASAPAKAANGAAGRPKTRGGPSKDSTSSGTGTRPSTRSGERDLASGTSKQPEGEPPWMISAYRPDPRLPPDQQLLPTVARRLQQEKWEREGKFGNVYDKEFRPLNEEGFLEPPGPADEIATAPEEEEQQQEEEKKAGGNWPLRPEPAGSPPPTLLRTGSYSTIPKINDKLNLSPLPSPRNPVTQRQPTPVVRTPEPPEDIKEKKAGCGCCIVM